MSERRGGKRGGRISKSDAEAAVRRFVLSGDHPCSIGVAAERAGEIMYVQLSDTNPEKSIREAMHAFIAQSPRALVIIFPQKFSQLPIAGLEEKARQLFIEAFVGVAETHNPGVDRDELRAEVIGDVGDRLRNPEAETHPHIGHPKEGGLYSTFMGPYERPHARYAPQAMMVMTRHRDVAGVFRDQPLLAESVRQKSFDLMGGPYDGQRLIAIKPKQ